MSDRYIIDENGCWIWQGRRSGSGYAFVSTPRGDVVAHRMSYLLHRGSIPIGMMVCHRCDVRICINPDHLFLGKAKDNVSDMIGKRRHCHGEKSMSAKLTEEQVLQIRESKFGTNHLARQFDVSCHTIRSIIRRDTWKHLPVKQESKDG